MSVIFLAGVHGVGKGFLGAPVAKSLGLNHCTASQLIREEKGRATWGKERLVAEVEDNQLALIRAVTRRLESGGTILLDGHFVLRGASGELVKLQVDVFSGLHLSGAIILAEDAAIVVSRLAGRDGFAMSEASIAELASEEISHAKDVCLALQIPLVIIRSPSEVALTNAVTALLAK